MQIKHDCKPIKQWINKITMSWAE